MNYNTFLENKKILESFFTKKVKEKYVAKIIVEMIDDIFIMKSFYYFAKNNYWKYSSYGSNEIEIYYKNHKEILSNKFIKILSNKFIENSYGMRRFWDNVSLFCVLSENFINKYRDKVHWVYIYCHQYKNISKKFLIKNSNDIFWNHISHQNLSEDFIRKFKNELHWNSISKFQILSEDFIREFKDKVNWDYIYKYQKVSKNFKEEFKNKL